MPQPRPRVTLHSKPLWPGSLAGWFLPWPCQGARCALLSPPWQRGDLSVRPCLMTCLPQKHWQYPLLLELTSPLGQYTLAQPWSDSLLYSLQFHYSCQHFKDRQVGPTLAREDMIPLNLSTARRSALATLLEVGFSVPLGGLHMAPRLPSVVNLADEGPVSLWFGPCLIPDQQQVSTLLLLVQGSTGGSRVCFVAVLLRFLQTLLDWGFSISTIKVYIAIFAPSKCHVCLNVTILWSTRHCARHHLCPWSRLI